MHVTVTRTRLPRVLQSTLSQPLMRQWSENRVLSRGPSIDCSGVPPGLTVSICPGTPLPVRAGRSLSLAVVLAWSSIVDNQAVCHDEGLAQSGPCTNEGAPASAPCVSCPCRLPVTAPPPMPELDRLLDGLEETLVWPEHHLHAIDSSAPPSPPPLA